MHGARSEGAFPISSSRVRFSAFVASSLFLRSPRTNPRRTRAFRPSSVFRSIKPSPHSKGGIQCCKRRDSLSPHCRKGRLLQRTAAAVSEGGIDVTLALSGGTQRGCPDVSGLINSRRASQSRMPASVRSSCDSKE